VLAFMRASVLPSAGQTASALRTNPFAARWLACTIPCRRFVPGLAADNARLGADAVRYSFIAVDSHHLLLAGLPAHLTPMDYGTFVGIDALQFKEVGKKQCGNAVALRLPTRG
jgi:hypothetical protein